MSKLMAKITAHPLMMTLFAVFAWMVNAPIPTLFCFVTFATLLYIKNVMVFPIFPKANGCVEGVFKVLLDPWNVVFVLIAEVPLNKLMMAVGLTLYVAFGFPKSDLPTLCF